MRASSMSLFLQDMSKLKSPQTVGSIVNAIERHEFCHLSCLTWVTHFAFQLLIVTMDVVSVYERIINAETVFFNDII
jgi:hypothetical protein